MDQQEHLAQIQELARVLVQDLGRAERGPAPAERDCDSIAAHVLFQFGDLEHGRPAGSFTTALLDMIARADPYNRVRLSHAFPVHTAFVWIAQNSPIGMEVLRETAANRPGTVITLVLDNGGND